MAQKLNIDIVARDKTKQALGRVQGALSKVKGAVFNLQSAFVGLGAGLVIRNLVNTGKELENLQVRLKFLLKDTNEGAKAFENMTKFASQVPFSLEEIQSGAGILATVTDNAEDLQKMLEITGNVASVTGLDFRTTAEQIQRAFAGGIASADIFREKGVRALLGFEEGARFSAAQTKEHIMNAFRDGSAVMIGASDEMADTFTGTMSMMSDKLFQFQKKLMESGPFDLIKGMMKAADEALTANFGSIENAAEMMGKKITEVARTVLIGGAKMIDAIMPVFRFIGNAIGNLIESTNQLHPTIKALGLIGFLMLGIKGKAVVLAIGAALKPIKSMFAEIFELQAKATKFARDFTPLLSDERKAIMTQNIKEMEDAAARLRGEMDETEDKFKDAEVNLEVPKFFDAEADIKEIGEYEKAVRNMLDGIDKKTAQSALNQYNDKIMLIAKEQKQALIKEAEKQEQLRLEQEKANKLNLLKKQTFNKLVTEAEQKEAKKRLFIAKHLNDQKLAFKKMEHDGVIAFEEKMRKKELFLAQHNAAQKRKFHELEREGVKKFNEENISFLQAYTEGFKNQIGQQKSTLDQLRDAGANAFNSLADSLTNFVMTGKFKFKDFANMVIRELVRIAAQAAITFALKKAASMFTFGIPFFAEGGDINRNQPAIVGEKGPELFVPSTSGKIIPNDQLGSGAERGGLGKTVNVNFTVNAIDSNSFQSTLTEQRDTIVGIINDAVMDKGRPAIA